MIYKITKEILTRLQNDDLIKSVIDNYNAIAGVPATGKDAEVNVGCHEIDCKEYTQDKDECYGTWGIYLSVPWQKLEQYEEAGEKIIVMLTERIRYLLTEAPTIVTGSSKITKVKFLTDFDRSKPAGSVIFLQVKFWLDRQRPSKAPTVLTIKADIAPDKEEKPAAKSKKGE